MGHDQSVPRNYRPKGLKPPPRSLTSPSEAPFVFPTINASTQFRLLQYVETSGPDLSFSLYTFELSSPKRPPYFTLSYVWGAPDLCKQITVNGQTLRIARNLHDFLTTFSPRCNPQVSGFKVYPDMLYWIDAICIDQTSLVEKSKQVPLMKDIYHNSACTLAWLGSVYENSNLAFELIQKIGQEGRDIERGSIKSKDQNKLEAHLRELLYDPKRADSWKALDLFFRRQWWSRIWIRQEFIIPARLQIGCGEHWCVGVDLNNALVYLSRHLNLYTGIPKDGFPPNLLYREEHGRQRVAMFNNPGYSEAIISRDMRMYHTWKIPIPLLYLLHKLSEVNSTDPRDQIYGLLGLASDSSLLVPDPDYAASVAAVYASLVERYTHHYKSLDIICFKRPPTKQENLPSWVPDWSNRESGDLHMAAYGTLATHHKALVALKKGNLVPIPYKASGDTTPKVSLTSDLRLLTCAGILVDTIDGLGFARALHRDEKYHLVQSTSEGQLNPRVKDKPLTSILQVFSRVLVLDRMGLRIPNMSILNSFLEIVLRAQHGIEDKSSYFLPWWKENKSLIVLGKTLEAWAEEWAIDQPVNTSPDPSPSARGYTLDAAASIFHYCQRFVTTRQGALGMAPHTARSGDRICVLYGCNVPVVLRELPGRDFTSTDGLGDGKEWEFVGECFLWGFMDGKAVRMVREGKGKDRMFVLR